MRLEVDFNSSSEKIGVEIKELNTEPTKYHDKLKNLDFAHSGHTGFASIAAEMPKIKRHKKYLYEADYAVTDYKYALDYYRKNLEPLPIGGCSSLNINGIFGRNYDWKYTEQAEFVVRVPRIMGRYASIGVAYAPSKLTDDFVMSETPDELYKIVPFMLVDGENEFGLAVNINVVPADYGHTTGTIAEIEEKYKMCVMMLPRYLLDHYQNALEAANAVRDYISVYSPKNDTVDVECHLMISDKNSTYCVEFINNRTVVLNISDRPYITNFHRYGVVLDVQGKVALNKQGDGKDIENASGVTRYGMGLERFNILDDLYLDVRSVHDMFGVMEVNLRYTKTYAGIGINTWYTEFTGVTSYGDLRVTTANNYFTQIITDQIAKFNNRSRDPENPNFGTWHTVHTSVYDLDAKILHIKTQEESQEFEFKMEIQTKGDPGEPGPAGPQGPEGPQGPAGLTTKVIVNGVTYEQVGGIITLPALVDTNNPQIIKAKKTFEHLDNGPIEGSYIVTESEIGDKTLLFKTFLRYNGVDGNPVITEFVPSDIYSNAPKLVVKTNMGVAKQANIIFPTPASELETHNVLTNLNVKNYAITTDYVSTIQTMKGPKAFAFNDTTFNDLYTQINGSFVTLRGSTQTEPMIGLEVPNPLNPSQTYGLVIYRDKIVNTNPTGIGIYSFPNGIGTLALDSQIPTAYLASAAINNNKLVITNNNGGQVEFQDTIQLIHNSVVQNANAPDKVTTYGATIRYFNRAPVVNDVFTGIFRNSTNNSYYIYFGKITEVSTSTASFKITNFQALGGTLTNMMTTDTFQEITAEKQFKGDGTTYTRVYDMGVAVNGIEGQIGIFNEDDDNYSYAILELNSYYSMLDLCFGDYRAKYSASGITLSVYDAAVGDYVNETLTYQELKALKQLINNN